MINTHNVTSLPIKDKTPETCQELVDQLFRMMDDRDKKCKSAKEQLIENLKITADKYRTATGVLEAMRVIRTILKSDDILDTTTLIYRSKNLAITMAKVANKMAEDADDLAYVKMDELCDGYYNPHFADNAELIPDYDVATEMAEELMRLDLCRNVGPACEDLVAFIDRIEEEIACVTKKLEELDPDWEKKYEPNEQTKEDK